MKRMNCTLNAQLSGYFQHLFRCSNANSPVLRQNVRLDLQVALVTLSSK